MFRLQVILKVAFPWRNWEISGAWLLGSDGMTLPIAQALHCGGPRSNYTFRRASTFSLAPFKWFVGKLQIDVRTWTAKTFFLFFFLFLPWRIFVQPEDCLHVTLWIAASWAQLVFPVLSLPDLVTAARRPAIATCHGSVQVCKYKHAGIWQSMRLCSLASSCELLLIAALCITSPERGRDKAFETHKVKSRRHYSD